MYAFPPLRLLTRPVPSDNDKPSSAVSTTKAAAVTSPIVGVPDHAVDFFASVYISAVVESVCIEMHRAEEDPSVTIIEPKQTVTDIGSPVAYQPPPNANMWFQSYLRAKSLI